MGIGTDWLKHISKHTIVGRSSLNPFPQALSKKCFGLIWIWICSCNWDCWNRPVSPCPKIKVALNSCCHLRQPSPVGFFRRSSGFQASAVLRWRQSSAKSPESNWCWIQGGSLGSTDTSGRDRWGAYRFCDGSWWCLEISTQEIMFIVAVMRNTRYYTYYALLYYHSFMWADILYVYNCICNDIMVLWCLNVVVSLVCLCQCGLTRLSCCDCIIASIIAKAGRAIWTTAWVWYVT